MLSIDGAIQSASEYEIISITELLPTSDPVKKHCALAALTDYGLLSPCILLSYSPGSNVGNQHFVWKVPVSVDPVYCLENSQANVETIKKMIPTYHTWLMRSAMFKKFGRVSPSVKPSVLQYFYKNLTGLF